MKAKKDNKRKHPKKQKDQERGGIMRINER